MTENTDRRSSHARVPFEALVEIAAPDGAAFEAESVDLSATGMHLRTAFVPTIGTALTFRFEGDGGGKPVFAKGEVVWTEDADGGAEFGVRFAELGDADAEAIRQIVTIAERPSAPTFRAEGQPFSPVRIHIEGMPSPMRAALERSDAHAALVGSELKMLRLGARVELEDKTSQARRPAFVDGVACEIEPETRVPRLVVKLRYEVDPARIDGRPTEKAAMSNDAPAENAENTAAEPETIATAPRSSEQARQAMPVADEEPGGGARMKDTMKNAWVGVSSFATKTFARLGTTVALLRKKDGAADDKAEDGRRVTATIAMEKTKRTLRPQGASRDIGGESEDGAMEEIDSKKVALRRKIAVGAGVGVALLLGVLAFKKPAHHAPVAAAPSPELAPSSAPVTAPAPAASAPIPEPALAAAAPSGAPAGLVGESTGVDAKGNPNPFGTPTVKKGTKMVLKLDGPATEIKGMNMPNGFVVSIPNRKSLEAAGPLAAKDPRIGSAKVVNQAGGAELTIAFKDAPPAFQVKAKGDTLEIVLAHDKGVAKKGKGKGAAGAAPAAPKHPAKKK